MIFYSPGVKDSGTGKFLFVETGIREVFLVDSGNLGFGIRNTLELKESGIPLTIKIQNPSSTDKETGFRIENSRRGIQNPKLSWLPFHGTILSYGKETSDKHDNLSKAGTKSYSPNDVFVTYSSTS